MEESKDIVITPLRNVFPLAISPDQTEMTELARKQLEMLNSKSDRVPKLKRPTNSSTSEQIEIVMPIRNDNDELKPTKNILVSSILSKSELENEIRSRVAKQDPKKVISTIEIPQDLILSGLSTTSSNKSDNNDDAVQLHDQELIDILEGKSGEENEMYEVIEDEGSSGMVYVKDASSSTSFEIVTEDQISQKKAKLIEREIAMRQIASLPMRKNNKHFPAQAPTKPKVQQTIAQSLAADWCEDDKEEEMMIEVVNVPEGGEPKIKILNMTILNEAVDPKPKTLPPPKSELKVLNTDAPKLAPKILNINASSSEAPATFKRSRIVKKKEIWDPSSEKKSLPEKLPSLPPSITIKKLTKESMIKSAPPVEQKSEEPISKPVVIKKGKKRSEIDKLLQDEGAVNMIYSLERENKNGDVPEIEVKPDQESLIDKSEEKSLMVNKARAIRNVVMKQSTSPQDAKPAGRARAKNAKVDEDPSKAAPAKAPKTSNTGRKKKDNETASSWDFMYSQAQAACDDAMIIRRRSNSSYSSSAASPRRLSVDVNESFESPPASAKKMKLDKDAFQFTKPPQKNTKSAVDTVLNKDFVDELRGKITNVMTKKSAPAAKGRKRAATSSETTTAKRASERRSNGSDHKEYKIVREGRVAHVVISQNPLSISLLSEMKSVLNQLETEDCQVVLITFNEGLSEGLDYSTLVQTTNDKRKQAASDLVTALKNFLISLAAFPKILIAGLQGAVTGIGVCMLPLFDLVFADATASFSLSHAKIGSNPEGVSILKLSQKVQLNAVNQMFYLNETLSAESALQHGIISNMLVSEDFETVLMDHSKKIAKLSSQALESTKSLLNEEFLSSIESHLSKEVKILQQQWISTECQEKFKKHDKGDEW